MGIDMEDNVPLVEMEPDARPRILVADDDPTLRLVQKRVLGDQAIVTLAENGQQALDLFNECGGNVDAVISDNTMPGMKGRELLSRVKEKAGDKVFRVLASGDGFTDDEISQMVDGGEINAFIHKPYGIDKVEEILLWVKDHKVQLKEKEDQK